MENRCAECRRRTLNCAYNSRRERRSSSTTAEERGETATTSTTRLSPTFFVDTTASTTSVEHCTMDRSLLRLLPTKQRRLYPSATQRNGNGDFISLVPGIQHHFEGRRIGIQGFSRIDGNDLASTFRKRSGDENTIGKLHYGLYPQRSLSDWRKSARFGIDWRFTFSSYWKIVGCNGSGERMGWSNC